MNNQIRPITRADLEDLKKVVDSCELFPSEYLAEMIDDYLYNPDTQDFWFTCVDNQKAIAIGYCVPEKFTDGTYNLLAIGVARDAQRKGIAREMTLYIEQYLKEKDGRVLIVETSSDDAQAAARNFYTRLGYLQTATIPDFWKEGEDKIVFWKKL